MAFVLLLMIGIIFGAGLFLLLKSFRIGVMKRVDRAKDLKGVPIQNPERYIPILALLNFLGGLGFLSIVAAIPVFSIPLNQWGPLTGIVAWSYALSLSILASHAKKRHS